MSRALPVGFSRGTHRLVSPRATLERIRPALAACGITRCTSVTHLDHLGIPVHCAVRPAGLVLQVSNGKGLTRESAQASALMEAVELHHAEHPVPGRLRWASQAELEGEGARVISATEIDGWTGGYFSPSFRLEWIEGEELGDAGAVWAPASVACFARSPSPLVTHTNGLASGNHLVEATLHALYELLERDALSGVSVDGRLRIRERCRAVVPDSIPDEELRTLVQRVEAHDTKVVLLWVESRVPVHSFWSIFVNRRPGASVSTLNLGAGCHCDPVVAAARAITEAAQSRLAFIHGAREDRVVKPVGGADRVRSSPAYRFFDGLAADTRWGALPHVASTGAALDLFTAHEWLLGELRAAGQRIVRFDLTQPAIGIPVVKLLAPGLGFNRRLL